MSLVGTVIMFSILFFLTIINLKKRNYCEVSITLLVLFYCMINKKTPQIELKEFNKNHFSELNTWVQLQPAKYNVTVGEKKFTARYGQILTNTELLQEFSTTQHLFLFNKNIKFKRFLISRIRGKSYLAKQHLDETPTKIICYVDEIKNFAPKKLRPRHVASIWQNENLSTHVKAFTQAFLFGDKTALSQSQLTVFRNSGTLHLFAVSGLHVGCLFLAISKLLRLSGMKQITANLTTMIILMYYLHLVNFSVSSVRAYLMLLIWVSTRLIGVRVPTINTLCVAGTILLISDNNNINNLGFILSISVVLTIIWLLQDLNKNYHLKFLKHVTHLNLINIAAFCGSFLVLAKSFSLIVPISLISNMVLIPIIAILMPISFITISLSWLPYTESISSIYNFTIIILIQFCEIMAGEKWSYITLKNNKLISIEQYYFYMMILLITINLFTRIKTKIAFLISICALFLFI